MSPEWILHSKLFRIITFDVSFTNRSPLRIGESKGKSPTSLVDLAVLKINISNKELPYIPGSSLKGVFRSTAENITRSHNIHTCNAGIESKELNEDLNNTVKRNNIEEIKKVLDNYCLCCKIFGSNSYDSHIVFSDAYVFSDFSLGIKTGIAINRRSGSVRSGALYEVEYVNPGAVFKGEIRLTNLPNYALGLIAKVIDYINLGIVKIGGFKSRGFGEVECKINDIDGMINVNGNIKRLEKVNILGGLDDKDKDISITIEDINNPSKILDKAKMVFNEYVNASK